jgi:hypothetical protein
MHLIRLLRQKQIAWCRVPHIACEQGNGIARADGQLLCFPAFVIGWHISFDLKPALMHG